MKWLECSQDRGLQSLEMESSQQSKRHPAWGLLSGCTISRASRVFFRNARVSCIFPEAHMAVEQNQPNLLLSWFKEPCFTNTIIVPPRVARNTIHHPRPNLNKRVLSDLNSAGYWGLAIPHQYSNSYPHLVSWIALPSVH